jgi:hypothetical protein
MLQLSPVSTRAASASPVVAATFRSDERCTDASRAMAAGSPGTHSRQRISGRVAFQPLHLRLPPGCGPDPGPESGGTITGPVLYGIWLDWGLIYIGQTREAERRLKDLAVGESHHLANTFPPEIWSRVVVLPWPRLGSAPQETEGLSEEDVGLGLEYGLQSLLSPLANASRRTSAGTWRSVDWTGSRSRVLVRIGRSVSCSPRSKRSGTKRRAGRLVVMPYPRAVTWSSRRGCPKGTPRMVWRARRSRCVGALGPATATPKAPTLSPQQHRRRQRCGWQWHVRGGLGAPGEACRGLGVQGADVFVGGVSEGAAQADGGRAGLQEGVRVRRADAAGGDELDLAERLALGGEPARPE